MLVANQDSFPLEFLPKIAMIWWQLWKARNNLIFQQLYIEVYEMMG